MGELLEWEISFAMFVYRKKRILRWLKEK